MEKSHSDDYSVNLPKPKGYTYDIRLRGLLEDHPIYIGDSFEQLMEESVHLTLAEQQHFRKLISSYHILTITDPEHQTINKP